MFVKIMHYPSSLSAEGDPYEIVINTDHIMYIKSCTIVRAAEDYLDEHVLDGYMISTVEKNFFITQADGIRLMEVINVTNI